MRKKPLHVTLAVREPSTVDVTVGEKVQLDRLVPTRSGCVAERHGALLNRGVTRLALAPGRYFFKTLSDAHLKVIRGGVDASELRGDKDTPPEPRLTALPKGDDLPGDAPSLIVE